MARFIASICFGVAKQLDSRLPGHGCGSKPPAGRPNQQLRLGRIIAIALVGVAGLRSAPGQNSSAYAQCDTCDRDSSLVQKGKDCCDRGECTGCGGCCGKDAIWARPTLTGDWFGHRSCLQESGITFRGNVTQFAFGVDGGINTPVPPPLGQGDTFKYTGRGEYDLIFDLEKFGGLPKGSLLVRAEHWYGEYGNVALRSGAFAPPVFPTVLPTRPDDPGVPYLTNFLFTQPLSEKLVVFAGKKDVLGSTDQDIFAGGDGTEQFINQALIANPAFLLGLPYSSFTAGAAMPRNWGMMSVFLFDPQDRTRDFFRLEDLFSQRIILGGEVKVNTNFFCTPGEHHIGGIWKHHDQVDLRFGEPPPGQYPYPQVPGVSTKSDAYTIYYGFDQYVRVFSDDGKGNRKGWGWFGRASISDENPTPLEYFLSAGIGGDSPLGCHRGDTFGIGGFYIGASTEFGPIPRALFGSRDGRGVEFFYNFQATPWLNITPDLQIVKPGGIGAADTAFIYGLRVNMKL